MSLSFVRSFLVANGEGFSLTEVLVCINKRCVVEWS